MALENFFAQFAPVDAPREPMADGPGANSATPPASFDDLREPHFGDAPHQSFDSFDSLDPIDPFEHAQVPERSNTHANMGTDTTAAAPAGGDMSQLLDERARKIRGDRRRRALTLGIGIGIPTLLAAILLGVALWAWGSGRIDVYGFQVNRLMQNSGGLVGLTVDDVTVTGRAQTSLEDIAEAIGANHGDAILSINPQEVKSRLETLPWIESASVERVLPKGLSIALVERQAVAIWQSNGVHRLIDRHGIEILGAPVEPFVDQLLIITGNDAPAHAFELIDALKGEPELLEQTLAATRVGNRRWDVTLLGEVIVKLPEDDMDRAWNVLAEAQRRGRLLDRDISVVDLRSPDRIIVTDPHEARPNQANFRSNHLDSRFSLSESNLEQLTDA